MKKPIIIRALFLLMLSLWMASCTKEPSVSDQQWDEPVRIDLSTRAIMDQTIEGVKITTMRLIAAQQNRIVFNRTVADGGLLEGSAGNLEFDIAVGTYDFYAVINETQDLSRVATVFDLMRIQVPQSVTVVDAALAAEKGLCLFGSRPGVVLRRTFDKQSQVSLDGGATWQSTLALPVERVAVKLDLLFKTVAGVTATIKSIKLRQTPMYSVLGQLAYDSPNFQPETTIFGSGSASVQIGESVKQVVTAIIPEYLLSQTPATDGAKAAEMVVDYEVMGQAKSSVVKLYHAFDGTDKDYNLYRDHCYHLTGTFKYPDLLIHTVVLPWNNLPLTDNNGVAPTIKKVIEDFTPCDGIAQFTVGLSEAAQWRVVIDNPNDFTVVGKKANAGTGDIGGVFNVIPRAFPKQGDSTSTKVQIVVNGQIVDETTVASIGRDFEYGWYLLGNGTNSLYVADRNLGASTSKGAGCLYKYGSTIGTSYNSPTFAITPSEISPLGTYRISAWKKMTDRYVASAAVPSTSTSWASIPFQSSGGEWDADSNPCPAGWRLLTPADFNSIINAKLTAQSVKSYGTFAKGAVSGRILTDEQGDEQYFPVMHHRNTTGVLSPNAAVTAGYYWLDNAQAQAITSSASSVASFAATNGAYLRCVAEPFAVTNETMRATQVSYLFTVSPLFDKPWTIQITTGGDWLQLSEDATWGSGQTTSVDGVGDKSFYLQPTRNNSSGERTTMLLLTDGEAYQTVTVTQNAMTSVSTGVMIFARTNHSPGVGIATSMDDGALNTFQLCTKTSSPSGYQALGSVINLRLRSLDEHPQMSMR